MHFEFHPADAPDSAHPDVQFNVSAEQITAELIEICDEFFLQASTIVHTELSQYLIDHGHRGDLGWFLDALGSTASDSSTEV